MISQGFAQGLGVTALTIACMFVGFYIQEGMLRERLHAFTARVDKEVDLALAAKERRVQELERRVAEGRQPPARAEQQLH